VTPARCGHCPVAAGLRCPGEGARRLCELSDPGHPDYRPGYVRALSSHAEQMARAALDRLVAEALAEAPEAIPQRFGCCGS